MAGPYFKRQESPWDNSWWTIYDGDGNPIAYTECERPADVLLAALSGDLDVSRVRDYPEDVPVGEDDREEESDEDEA